MVHVSRKRGLAAFLVLVMGSTLLSGLALKTYAEPDETDDVLWIRTAAALQDVAEQVEAGDDFAGKTIALANDVEAASEFKGIGVHASTAAGRKPFNGTFDGQGHTITVQSSASSGDNLGLGIINHLGEEGVVKDLTVAGSLTGTITYNGNLYIGAVAGYSLGTVERCSTTADVTGNSYAYGSLYAGDVVGMNAGLVKDCLASGTVTVAYGEDANALCAGGIVGRLGDSGIVDGATFFGGTVRMDGEAVKAVNAGGIVGSSDYSSAIIRNCTSSGWISGDRAGGIVGSNSGKVFNSYSTAEVTGSRFTGGIVGNMFTVNSVLRNVYFAGSFGTNAASVGGIGGNLTGGTVRNVYYLSDLANDYTGNTGSKVADSAVFDATGALRWQDGAEFIQPVDAAGAVKDTTLPLKDSATLLQALQAWQKASDTAVYAFWKQGESYPVFGIAEHTHRYGAPEYTWSKTTEGYDVTARAICAEGDDTAEEIVHAVLDVAQAATCTDAGSGVYTATFSRTELFSTQTKEVTLPALGHIYSDPKDNDDGTHTAVCARCGEQVTENCVYEEEREDGFWYCQCGSRASRAEGGFKYKNNTGSATEGSVYVIFNGSQVMSNTKKGGNYDGLAGAGVTVSSDSDGYKRMEKEGTDLTTCLWVWEKDGYLRNYSDPEKYLYTYYGHLYIGTAAQKTTFTLSGTTLRWTTSGSNYALTFSSNQFVGHINESNAFVGKVVFDDPTFVHVPKGTHIHQYGVPTWQWAADYSGAEAVFTCEEETGTCDAPTVRVTAAITEDSTPATCTATGEKRYTAAATGPDGTAYTDTRKETIPIAAHAYTYADNGDGTHTKTCTVGGETVVEAHTYVDGICSGCGLNEHKSGEAVWADKLETGHTYIIFSPDKTMAMSDEHGVFSTTGADAYRFLGKAIDIDQISATYLTEYQYYCEAGANGGHRLKRVSSGKYLTYYNTLQLNDADLADYPNNTKRFEWTYSDDALQNVDKGSNYRLFWYEDYGWFVLNYGDPSDKVALLDITGLTGAEPAHEHEYGSPTWNWTSLEHAEAIFTCVAENCDQSEGATLTVPAAVTWTVEDATCGADGEIRYTATAKNPLGKSFSDVKTVPLPATGEHTFENGVCKVCGAEDPDYPPLHLVIHPTDAEGNPLNLGLTVETIARDSNTRQITVSLPAGDQRQLLLLLEEGEGSYRAVDVNADATYTIPADTTSLTVAIRGDANGDGRVDIGDLVLLRSVASGANAEGIQDAIDFLAADYNVDGAITLADLAAVIAIATK